MFRELTGRTTFDLLRKGLDVSAMRNKVVSNNIANVNTPGYKRQIVSFEDEMTKVFDGKAELAGRRERDEHIPIGEISWRNVEPTLTTDRAHLMRNDKNNRTMVVTATVAALRSSRWNCVIEGKRRQAAAVQSGCAAGRRQRVERSRRLRRFGLRRLDAALP